MKRVCILLALLLTVCFFISCSNAPQIETDAVPQKVIGVPESLGKSLSEGTVQIDAKIEPAEASQALKWQSSDERIATVENGKITLLQEGVTVNHSHERKRRICICYLCIDCYAKRGGGYE